MHRRIVELSVLVAAIAPSSSRAQTQIPCTADFVHEYTPEPTGPVWVIGAPGQGSYSKHAQLIPEAVPLAFSVKDIDQIFLKCPAECRERAISGIYTGDWWIETQNGADGGRFVTGRGDRVSTYANSDLVLYLPPRNLSCGESREIIIHALPIDNTPFVGLKDPYLDDVKFKVMVTRNVQPSTYDVDIHPYGNSLPGSAAAGCSEDTYNCCMFAGESDYTAPNVTGSIFDWPEYGMRTDEMRLIALDALDLDSLAFECGIPPNCSSAFALGLFTDELTYQWQLISGSGTILPFGRSIIFKATQPGPVTVEVQIIGGADAPLTLQTSFQVFKVDFITQNNTPVAALDGSTPGQAGLRISRRVTNEANSLNGCGGPAATFDGPVPSNPDPHTYRVEIDAGTPAGGTPPPPGSLKVKLAVHRAWPTADYESSNPNSATFDTLPAPNPSKARSDLHVRLVSNILPNGPTPPAGSIYDCGVCGPQTFYVHVGDWIVATLLVNNIPACQIELPVERPWSETGLPADPLPWPIRGMSVHLIATADAVFDAFYNSTGWPAVAQYHVRRLAEDFGQAALCTRLEFGSPIVGGPFANAFFVSRATGSIASGTIRLSISGSGAPLVSVTIPSNWDSHTAAVEIHHQLILNGYVTATIAPLEHWVNGGDLIIVAPASAVTVGVQSNSSGVPIAVAPQNHADNLFSLMEAAVQAGNLKPIEGPLQNTIDYFVVKDSNIVLPAFRGLTFSPSLAILGNNLALRYSIFVANTAAEGSDVNNSIVFSHEAGHFLMDEGGHTSDPQFLMTLGSNQEVPARGRRIPTSQLIDVRTDGTPFFSQVCVQVPNLY